MCAVSEVITWGVTNHWIEVDWTGLDLLLQNISHLQHACKEGLGEGLHSASSYIDYVHAECSHECSLGLGTRLT